MPFYTVTVTMTVDYSIEADSEDDAEHKVQPELPHNANVDSIKAELEE